MYRPMRALGADQVLRLPAGGRRAAQIVFGTTEGHNAAHLGCVSGGTVKEERVTPAMPVTL